TYPKSHVHRCADTVTKNLSIYGQRSIDEIQHYQAHLSTYAWRRRSALRLLFRRLLAGSRHYRADPASRGKSANRPGETPFCLVFASAVSCPTPRNSVQNWSASPTAIIRAAPP